MGNRGTVVMSTRIAKASKASYDLGRMTKLAEARFTASRADEDYRALMALVDAWHLVVSNWQNAVASAWDKAAVRIDREVAIQ